MIRQFSWWTTTRYASCKFSNNVQAEIVPVADSQYVSRILITKIYAIKRNIGQLRSMPRAFIQASTKIYVCFIHTIWNRDLISTKMFLFKSNITGWLIQQNVNGKRIHVSLVRMNRFTRIAHWNMVSFTGIDYSTVRISVKINGIWMHILLFYRDFDDDYYYLFMRETLYKQLWYILTGCAIAWEKKNSINLTII